MAMTAQSGALDCTMHDERMIDQQSNRSTDVYYHNDRNDCLISLAMCVLGTADVR